MAKYVDIADALRARIGAEFAVGDRLPPISALQDEYGARGLNTVRDALKILASEGLISTEHGRGSFVAAVPPPRNREPADMDVLRLLGVSPRDRAVIVERAAAAGRSVETYLRDLTSTHASTPSMAEVLARAARHEERARGSAVDVLAAERAERAERESP